MIVPGYMLSPFYQPICRRDGSVAGFEALVRKASCDNPAQWLPPGELIESLEREGVVYHLDLYMWRAVLSCAVLKLKPRFITVNTSVVTLQNKAAVAEIINLFEQYRKFEDNGTRVYLEVTETASIENLTEVRSALMSVKRAGIGVILDDFGSGYNSLGMLLKLESLDMVKFGHHVTNEVLSGGRAFHVMKELVSMFRKKRVPVVFEGIETQGNMELMESLRPDFFQGYYFGRPCSADAWLNLSNSEKWGT